MQATNFKRTSEPFMNKQSEDGLRTRIISLDLCDENQVRGMGAGLLYLPGMQRAQSCTFGTHNQTGQQRIRANTVASL
jgi:hypothetical protein